MGHSNDKMANKDLKAYQDLKEKHCPAIPYWSSAMNMLRFISLILLVFVLDCQKPTDIATKYTNSSIIEPTKSAIKGALLSSRFDSFEELKKVVRIEYFNVNSTSRIFSYKKPTVRLTHRCNGLTVISTLQAGIGDEAFKSAQAGGWWKRVQLGINSPYIVRNRNDLLRVFILARRNFKVFGQGDVAFFTLAERIVYNINDDDLALLSSKDLSEKGFLNTFNHITAQAFMTAIFSEKFADFIADAHERSNLPELITGKFSEDQILDLETGPVDNYVDMINNEWGQELGKTLRKKYDLSRDTYWTPELLSNFLNDVQSYYSWAFKIGFKPFTTEDEDVIRFSNKINSIMRDLSGF